VSIYSEDDTNYSKVSYSESDSEHDRDVHMHIENDVDAPSGVDFDGNVEMEWDDDNDKGQDEEEQDEDNDDDDEDEDEDEDDRKEPRMIGLGEMVCTSVYDVDNIVDDQPTVLPRQGKEMHELTPRPQSQEPLARPPTPEPHALSPLEFLGLVKPQIPHLVALNLLKSEAARNTSNVDVEQQLLSTMSVGDNLSNVTLAEVLLRAVFFPVVSLPNVPLPDVSLTEMDPDGLGGQGRTSSLFAGKVCVQVEVMYMSAKLPLT
jgi:hypothetical protein